MFMILKSDPENLTNGTPRITVIFIISRNHLEVEMNKLMINKIKQL